MNQQSFNLKPGSEIAMRPCDEMIKITLELVDRMAQVADEGDLMREDAGCGVLYGVLRDSAFKIRKLAEEERDAHIRKGWWQKKVRGSS
jgi:hypothetical protein